MVRIGDASFEQRQGTGVRLTGVVEVDAPAIATIRTGHKTIAWASRHLAIWKGQIVFMAPGSYRFGGEDPNGRVLLMLFDAEGLSGFRARYPDARLAARVRHQGELAFEVPHTPFLEAAVESVSLFMSATPGPASCLIQHKRDEILLSLVDADDRVLHHLDAASRQPSNLVRYVESRQFEHRSLSDIARGAGQSLSAFKRRFQEATGSPPGAWLRTRRLDHARILLETTNRSVAEIAMDAGYASLSHFVQAFRQQHGDTPRRLRQLRRNVVARLQRRDP